MPGTYSYPAPASWGPAARGLAWSPDGLAPAAQEEHTPLHLLAVIGAVYLMSVPMLSRAGEIGLVWLPQALGVVLGVAWLVIGAVIKRQPLVWAPPVTLYLAFCLWSLTGMPLTSAPIIYKIAVITQFKVAAVTWVLSQCIRTRRDLLTCFLFIGIAVTVIYRQGESDIQEALAFKGTELEKSARAGETMAGNANKLGIFSLIVLLGIVGWMVAARGLFLRGLALLPAPFALYTVAASGSRKPMVGMIAAALGLFVFHFRKAGGAGGKKVFLVLVGLLVLGGSLLFVSRIPLFFRLTETFESEEAFTRQARWIYFLIGMKATAEHPVFGLGLGGFAAEGLAGSDMSYSHSTVTETLTCTGIPGFLLYFGGMFAMFRMLWKLRKTQLPQRDAALVNVVFVLFLVVLLFNAAAVMYQDRFVWPILGAICGYLAQLKRTHQHPAAFAAPAR